MVEARRERKVVTVLFADLVGFTSRAEQMDPEDVAAELARYQGRVQTELERYGGTVEKFICDAAMAIFGAPTAHEDDPERAVRAALAIRDWAREEGIELRVGINTGEALVTIGARPEAGETMARGTWSTPPPGSSPPRRSTRSWPASRPSARPSRRSTTRRRSPSRRKGKHSP